MSKPSDAELREFEQLVQRIPIGMMGYLQPYLDWISLILEEEGEEAAVAMLEILITEARFTPVQH